MSHLGSFYLVVSHLRTQAVASERPRLTSQLRGLLTNHTALSLSFFKSKQDTVNVQVAAFQFYPNSISSSHPPK